MKQALLIPIYQPNAKVLPFLKSMNPGDFSLFVVVNDGSDSKFDPFTRKYRSFRPSMSFHIR
jgi:hypothetical protein